MIKELNNIVGLLITIYNGHLKLI